MPVNNAHIFAARIGNHHRSPIPADRNPRWFGTRRQGQRIDHRAFGSVYHRNAVAFLIGDKGKRLGPSRTGD